MTVAEFYALDDNSKKAAIEEAYMPYRSICYHEDNFRDVYEVIDDVNDFAKDKNDGSIWHFINPGGMLSDRLGVMMFSITDDE